MKRTCSDGLIAGLQSNDFEYRKLMIYQGNSYVRLSARDRRDVMRALKQFTFGKAKDASYWDRWSKEDMESCFLQLKPISPKMANDFHRWASGLLKTGRNNKLALKCLMDELTVRTWIEEP
jgi:hypothetical protein